MSEPQPGQDTRSGQCQLYGHRVNAGPLITIWNRLYSTRDWMFSGAPPRVAPNLSGALNAPRLALEETDVTSLLSPSATDALRCEPYPYRRQHHDVPG